MPKRKRNRKSNHLLEQTINPDSAGIDIGAEEIVVAIPLDREDAKPVRTFESFTVGLEAIRDWLHSHKVTTVAMESTGVYWIPLYDLLEQSGIEVCLVNARHVKGVPGKKTDVCDAQWLQKLHSAGLLKASFRPRSEILTVRQLMRYRATCIQSSARQLQHMQKALDELNLQIHRVFSDLDGASAMRILEAILNGQRDVDTLWNMRDRRVKATKEQFCKAMQGNYQPAQLFILKRCHAKWQSEQEAISACDTEIEKYMKQAAPEDRKNASPLEETKKHKRKLKNSVSFDIYQMGYQYFGVDLSTIDGVSAGCISILMSEIGNKEDFLKSFKSAKHFSSWLGLCPDVRISGGKVLQTKTRRVVNKVTEALRMSAYALENSKSELGQYARRMKGRLGKVEGITAAAHKIARLIYAMISSGQSYDEKKAFKPNSYSRDKKMKLLQSLANSLDIELPTKSLK